MKFNLQKMKELFNKNSFTGPHQEIFDELVEITEYFFTLEELDLKIPFRGFLLNGKPASGKTEIVKQLAYKVAKKLKPANIRVELIFVNSSDISSGQVGGAEQKLAGIFNQEDQETKYIIFFDDIDCIFLNRNSKKSQNGLMEGWLYRINSTLFHELDMIDPRRIIFVATSNIIKMVDNALETRLYRFDVPKFTRAQLLTIMKKRIPRALEGKEELITLVKQELESTEHPNIRYLESLITRFFIKEIKNRENRE